MAVETRIEQPAIGIVPYGVSALNGELAAGGSTLTLDDASIFEDAGFVKIESEYIYYAAKSGNNLTGLERAKFSSSDVTHADDTAVYMAVPVRAKISLHDADVPKAPNSTPDIEIVDMNATSIVGSTAMTQEGSLVGIYYYDLVLVAGTAAPNLYELQFTIEQTAGNTNYYRTYMVIMEKPATESEITGEVGASLRYCDQDGYYDGTGTWVAWTDAYVGYFVDDDGNRLFEGIITAYNKVGGAVEYQQRPPAQTETDVLGNWSFRLPAGTYEFFFYKDQIKDVHIERTVT